MFTFLSICMEGTAERERLLQSRPDTTTPPEICANQNRSRSVGVNDANGGGEILREERLGCDLATSEPNCLSIPMIGCMEAHNKAKDPRNPSPPPLCPRKSTSISVAQEVLE